ncbi:hypothetical protein ACFXJ8_25895 [Nonomuraea sp. NPDC059194]|uniref:hypothetical protein n=1 Tax=Nonomuraea sp. NPDC059194 TaxID=3346764 RepID=UPI003684BF7A
MSDFAAGALIFAGIVLFFGGWLLLDMRIHHKSQCRRCKGGRLYSPWSARWRDCPDCGGSGIKDRRTN